MKTAVEALNDLEKKVIEKYENYLKESERSVNRGEFDDAKKYMAYAKAIRETLVTIIDAKTKAQIEENNEEGRRLKNGEILRGVELDSYFWR